MSKVLWDNGKDKFCVSKVEDENAYIYVDGQPCLTAKFCYENDGFKGYDYLAFFGEQYAELINTLEKINSSLNGKLRVYDMGADTDAFIDIELYEGKATVKGRLGATFSANSLTFEFFADQTLLTGLLDFLKS